MKILDRYFLREMVVPFLIGQAAVVLMLTGTVLYNNADYFLRANVPAMGVVKVAFYFMPFLVSLTMPVATAIATSLVVSRLAKDSEITVIRAAGVSLRRIFLPLICIGFGLSLLDFYFSEKVVPWSNQQYQMTVSDLSRSSKVFVPQSQQVVQSKDRRTTAYIDRIQFEPSGRRAKLFDVLVLKRDAGGAIPEVIISDTADYDAGKWTLYDARIHRYTNHGISEQFIRAPKAYIDFRLEEKTFMAIPIQLPFYSDTGNAGRSWRELRDDIARQRENYKRAGLYGLRVDPLLLLEYHFKLSVPFSCLVFAIICPPLALRFARSGNFMGVLLSICLVFVYWNTLLAARILGGHYADTIPPYVFAWGQNAVFTLVGIFLLWKGE